MHLFEPQSGHVDGGVTGGRSQRENLGAVIKLLLCGLSL